MAKAKKGAADRRIGHRVQVIPLADLLNQPPLWWRLWMGARAHFLYQTWTGWFPSRKASILAAVCLFLQIIFLGLLLIFNLLSDYASLQEWQQISLNLFISLVLVQIPIQHCAAIRSQWGKSFAPALRLYSVLYALFLPALYFS
jgi:hypothetical protein